jgi:hypothetical protein
MTNYDLLIDGSGKVYEYTKPVEHSSNPAMLLFPLLIIGGILLLLAYKLGISGGGKWNIGR